MSVTFGPTASTTPAPSLPAACGSGIGYRPERWEVSTKLTPIAVWRTRAWPGPGSPTGTSSSCSTSGPPVLWKRIAFGISLSFRVRIPSWRDGPHSLQRGALQFQSLDREFHHVEVHVEPGLDRAQVGDALVELLRVERRHRHARQRHAERAPQAAEHLERVLRRLLLTHVASFPSGSNSALTSASRLTVSS